MGAGDRASASWATYLAHVSRDTYLDFVFVDGMWFKLLCAMGLAELACRAASFGSGGGGGNFFCRKWLTGVRGVGRVRVGDGILGEW